MASENICVARLEAMLEMAVKAADRNHRATLGASLFAALGWLLCIYLAVRLALR